MSDKARVDFTDEQLDEVWKSARKRGILFNGMTGPLLQERHRVVVYHEMGVGFYHLGEPAPESDVCQLPGESGRR